MIIVAVGVTIGAVATTISAALVASNICVLSQPSCQSLQSGSVSNNICNRIIDGEGQAVIVVVLILIFATAGVEGAK